MFDADTWPVVTSYPGAPIAAFDTIEQALAVAAGLSAIRTMTPDEIREGTIAYVDEFRDVWAAYIHRPANQLAGNAAKVAATIAAHGA